MSILKKYHNYVYYLIHDNMTRPFCVFIDEKHNEVHIYKNKKEDDDLKNYSEFIITYKPLNIFIGKSPLIPMTLFSQGHGPNFDGNSILLEMDKNKYIFIGSCIYSFTTKHKIISFISPVGNNDVPYPYAIDNKNNFYFLLESDRAILKIDDKTKYDEPYQYLYFIEKNINKIENINWLYMGDEQYNITTNANPEADYDDIIKRLSKQGPMYIQYKYKYKYKYNNQKKLMNKNSYVKLLKNYNKKVGLKPILNIKMIHERIW